MVDEMREVEHFERYWQQNNGTMDAVSLQATWLALKGAVNVKNIPNGVRIDRILSSYPMYNRILQKHTEVYKLSPDEISKRWKELAEYARVKLVG